MTLRPASRRAQNRLATWGVILALGVGLQVMVETGGLSRYVVSPPTEALGSLGELFVEDRLAQVFLLTLGMTFVAAACAIAVGVPLGLLLALNAGFWSAACMILAGPLYQGSFPEWWSWWRSIPIWS